MLSSQLIFNRAAAWAAYPGLAVLDSDRVPSLSILHILIWLNGSGTAKS